MNLYIVVPLLLTFGFLFYYFCVGVYRTYFLKKRIDDHWVAVVDMSDGSTIHFPFIKKGGQFYYFYYDCNGYVEWSKSCPRVDFSSFVNKNFVLSSHASAMQFMSKIKSAAHHSGNYIISSAYFPIKMERVEDEDA